MASTYLDLLLRNTDGIGFKLIPHVEEAAMRYVVYNSVMASRVLMMTDMNGWNVRKVSEYVKSRRAQTLAEDTDIPDTQLLRARKSIVEPYEVGERYRVTNRRSTTDRENILADVITALGESITERVEIDLINSILSAATGGSLGATSTNWSLGVMLQAATLFRARGRHGQLYHVVHPYQVLPEMEALVQYTGSTQEAALQYRDAAASGLASNQDLRSFNLPTFGGTNLAISEVLPRRVTYKLHVDGTGGTFRLEIGDGGVIGTNITAAITVSATPATMVSNIQAALDALPASVTGGTWVVSGTAIDDITLTPPANAYLADSDRLRIANKYDEDVVIVSDLGTIFMKSAYDLVTGTSSALVDKDGNDVGVALYERTGATARAPLFKRDAIIWDVRQGVQSFFETTKQGRTAEFSGHMVYGVAGWSPENAIYVVSKAEAPNAV